MISDNDFTVIEYIDSNGRSPFAKWFSGLNAIAAERVVNAITHLAHGNTSNTKSVGKGVFEYKIHFGPGYRLYFAYDQQTVVLLLHGGIKKRQCNDIKLAQAYWRDYKRRDKDGP